MKGYGKIAAQITNLLRAHPRGMTITDISRTLALNRNSVAKYLEILVTSGQVDKERIGRAKLFFLSQRVPLSAMLDLSSDMILILDGDGKIWYVNENLLAFEGKGREDLIGKGLKEAGLGILSDPEIFTRIGNPPVEEEFSREVQVGTDGGSSFFTVSLVPTIFEDGSRGTTLIIEDITLRKKAEKSLREHLFFFQEILDRVPIPVFYKDLQGHYLGCNRAFEEYARRPREEILGRGAAEVVPPELARQFETMDAIALKTGRTQSLESIFPYKDGTRRHFIVFKAPFLDEKGSQAGIVGTIIDTTNHKKAEESLEKRIQDLEGRIRDLGPATTGRSDRAFSR
jgi:PAS domain S-box-containing protein